MVKTTIIFFIKNKNTTEVEYKSYVKDVLLKYN